jgi:ribose transport system ATP-binding protein/rhamnose transport system ATP-binding protein
VTETALVMEGIDKWFPGVHALKGVDLRVGRGQVMGIVGENGAGKSTLIKVLAGAYEPDGGRIVVGGEQLEAGSPADALAAGVAVIYQELSLVPEMSVAENLFLGDMPARGGLLDRREARTRARQLLARVGLDDLSTGAPVRSLRLGVRQLVEVAKALHRDARILVMDEPTSALQSSEIQVLFDVVRDLRREGISVIYISHHLEEVFEICDAATVMRDGAIVGSRPIDEWTTESLVQAMVNKRLDSLFPTRERELGDVALEVKNLAMEPRVRNVSFSVREGEILGLAGVVGAGRTETLKTIGGVTPATGGEILVKGRARKVRTVSEGLDAGIVYVPEDRGTEGLVHSATINENMILSVLDRISRVGFVDGGRYRSFGQRLRERFGVRASSLKQEAGQLSGGNQQKVVLARAMATEPSVVLLDEPTRGIDVGAKSEIYEHMLGIAAGGGAVVMVSSEFPELLGMADRIVIMRAGRVVGEISGSEANQEKILEYATSGTEDNGVEQTGEGN